MIERITESDFILPILEPTPPPGVENAVGADDIEKPLLFRLYYNEGKVENTIYLNDSDPLDLSLEVYSVSDRQIKFNSLQGEQSANQKRSHFYVKFAKELQVDLNKLEIAESNAWKVGVMEKDENLFIFFRRKSELRLNRNDKILLTLKNFTVNNRTVKSTDVILYYGKHSDLLQVNGAKLDKEINFLKGVTVMKKPPSFDKNNIPLAGRFVGHSTILNDGTENQLTLRIFNRPLFAQSSPILLLDPDKSKFIISFETGDNKESLTGSTEANNVTITARENTKWDVQKTSNQAQWTITPKPTTPPQPSPQLAPSIGFDLDISNLKTTKTSGVGYLYIDYENIGDYPDGRLVVAIEKTPLLYKEQQVGIGTNEPKAKLDVKGNIRLSGNGNIEGGADRKLSIYSNATLFTSRAWIEMWGNEDINRLGELTLAGTYVDLRYGSTEASQVGSTGIRLTSEGKVGIGTTSPSAKLDVKGNIRLSGNIEGGEDRTFRIYSNTSSSNSRAWIEMWANEENREGELTLAGTYIDFRHNSTTSGPGSSGMRLTSDGKVGIGTTSPKKELHVVGDLALGKDENNKKFIFHSRKDNNGDYLQITYDKSDGTREATQGITLNRLGNVGIGTINPSAKLDVNGSVKLGDGSTAWNRIICGKVIIDYNNISNSKVFGKGISCARYIPAGYPDGSSVPVMGLFKITFEKSVNPEKLVVIVTPQDQYTDNIVNVKSVVNDGFTIQVKDSKDRTPENSSFHFIAIELTENINKLVTTTIS